MKRNSSNWRRWLAGTGVVAAAMFLAIPLFAAESGPSPSESTLGWVFRWLNFALVFGGGGYLIAKSAPAVFRKRAETIVAAITESARIKEEAEKRLNEAEEKLAALDKEIAAMRTQAKSDAAAEAERLRDLARNEAQKIESAAFAEIQVATRAARLELKAYGARLAIERAEAILRDQIGVESDAAVFRGFVADLGRSSN
ncbi:MAG: ATP synthase F0 subunit B [Candidatus Acidiferrales bacterium]